MGKWGKMLAVLVIGGAILAGCSSSKDNGNSPQNSAGASGNSATSSSGASPAQNQPLKTLTFLDYNNPSWPYSADWPIWKYLQEKTGVKLDIQVPPGTLEDATSLAVASGSMPDMIWTQEKARADKYGQQGALANILDYVDEMPNFKKWMAQFPEAVQAALAADGKMYVFPNEGMGETNRMLWMYRQDIFEKNGLKQPETWDELYATLKKLKELYPKSYPLTFRSGLRYLQNFGASFNTVGSVSSTQVSVYFDQDKKEFVYGATEDNFKKMVTYLNKFYKEGLIPPDFLTVDTKIWQDIMSTDRAFVTLDYIGRIDFYNSALRKNNPNFTLSFMKPPAGWEGGPQKNAYTQITEEGVMVSSQSKNIHDIMKYMDFFYTDEGKSLTSWGKEGETFKVEDGKNKFIGDFTDVSDLRKKTGISTDGVFVWFDYDSHISLASPELKVAYEEAAKYDSQPQPKPAFNQQEQEIISTKGDALIKNRDENISKFILGSRSLGEWDKYVQEQKKLGVDELLDVYKKAYERTLQATGK
ncbi:extracellular solute-binding protein [Cohnella sp. REN36]|uniref:extracellular solute-binding protein n=1 Tax=Cohnella sp. REN36 TaxID=2887347 RepID=UPI001D133553|nr:extracellular solute-binding protein [Cohnella sp. REN36]MCC3376758.1 extracellular solute-binding protein [Cohnella sp. REN36]